MFIRAIIFIGVTIAIILLISWRLTVVTFTGILPILIVSKCYGNIIKKISKKVQDAKAGMGSISEEAISCIRTVKAFSTEEFEAKRYKKMNQEAYEQGKSQAIWNSLFHFFTIFMMNSATAAIIYYGAILHKTGDITVGEITAFLLYMIQMIFNFVIISFVIGNIYKVSGASEKIVQMMKTEVVVNTSGGMILPDEHIVGEIELKNVNFHYPTKPSVKVSQDICIKVN